MAQASAVSAGQRYIKSYNLTRDRTEWEVVKVVGTALPHAQLVNCRDRSDMRTVSCAELTGGGVFDLAEGLAKSRSTPASTALRGAAASRKAAPASADCCGRSPWPFASSSGRAPASR